jgi:putative hydrolase of HD superfamily
VHLKADLPATLFRGRVSPLVEAYLEFCHLKQLYRQGWLRRGVPKQRCESVAEHSFGVAVLALFLVDAHFSELDREKVLRLALLHDFGEIYAGDLMPSDRVSPEEKHRREAEAVAQVLGKLPDGGEYVALWAEYEAGTTPEARLVRQVDRLEMGLQALVYERQGLADLTEFYASVECALSAPELRAVFDEVEGLRDLQDEQAP